MKKSYPHLCDIWFSDVSRDAEELEVEVLVGSDYLWNFQEGETILGGPHEPVAVKTALGWVLSGPLKGKKLTSECINVNFLPDVKSSAKVKSQLGLDVHKLWDLETLGIRQENEVHEGVIDDIRFTGQRYSVGLPWKVGCAPLASNYKNSLTRVSSQFKKLKRDPKVLDMYNDIILEQEKAGVIEKVVELESPEKVQYLPHMAVIRENAETTKVRVVYDASCKDYKTGTSLNDCLHVGPPLTPLIFDILLRFRTTNFALVGDIEKAFLNIEVHPTDWDCLRFLWFDDINAKESELLVYRFNRVVFGVNSSPFLLNAVLQYHIQTYKEQDPEFVSKLCEGFYVDDLVTGADSRGEGFKLYEKAKERMLEGGFRLRKWKTNDKVLEEKINLIENTSESAKNDPEP